MKMLLIYPPFAPPTIMSYSLANLKSLIENNSHMETLAIDLNAKFHKLSHLDTVEKIDKAMPIYEKNNRKILEGGTPEFFDDFIKLIKDEKPDYVALSILYSTQCFYAQKLIENIDCPVFIGGPGVSANLSGIKINSGEELLDVFGIKDKTCSGPDFGDFDARDYISPHINVVKSSQGCYYGMCSFCSHHKKKPYRELPLDFKEGGYFYFIDDMLPLKRLMRIALEIPENSKWWVQLRPTKDLIPNLKYFSEKGLKSVAWGVESGSQEILDRMNKGTVVDDMSMVLKEAKEAGIVNTVYIMFGFPGETEKDFLKTVDFLKKNEEFIDLVSTSVFGLQKGTEIYENPEKFGIKLNIEKRTILDEKITFYPMPESLRLKKSYNHEIDRINKFPKFYVHLKEQTLFL